MQYAPEIIVWLSEKIIEPGHQNAFKCALFEEKQKILNPKRAEEVRITELN